MTTLDRDILDALRRLHHLDRPELAREVPALPRGMPGHYVLKELEDNGLIKSRLPTRDVVARVYQLEEPGRKALEEMAGWPVA